jgi:hypothetical protein
VAVLALILAMLALLAFLLAAWYLAVAAWAWSILRVRPACAWLAACGAFGAGCNAISGADRAVYLFAGAALAAVVAWLLIGRLRA